MMPSHETMKDDETHFPKYVEITDVLDLHGFFPEQIPEVVEEFVRSAVEKGLKNVRIIHGKGRSRLKYAVHQALKVNPHIAWYGDAPHGYGGWGATIAELTVQNTIQENEDT
jgi:DNA-nicking Smr family endonuclease